jgi:hypothetical protein
LRVGFLGLELAAVLNVVAHLVVGEAHVVLMFRSGVSIGNGTRG